MVLRSEVLRALAEITSGGLQQWQRDHMIRFGIRVGTRRLEFLAMDVLAEAFRRQAVLLGQLQYLLTRVGQDSAAADVLRQLPDAHQSALVVLEDATRQVEAHAFGPSERLHGA